MRSLDAHGFDTTSLGAPMIIVFLDKMPRDMQLMWTRDKTRSATNLNAMLDFLRDELTSFITTASALHTQSKAAAKPDNTQRSGNFPCIFCSKEDHRSAACPMNLDQRMAAFKAKGRCYSCSKRGHRQSDCTENRKCVKCNGGHHVFICPSGSTKQSNGGAPKDSGAASKTMAAAAHQASQKDIILKTATVVLYGPKGFMRVRCLLDAGSHRSYVTTKVAETLGLKEKGFERLDISGFGEGVSARSLKRLKLGLGGLNVNKPACDLECLETERICDPISRVAIDQWLQRIDALDLPLAEDPEELRGESWNGEIDLLIGTEHYYEILTGETKRLSPQLMLVESIVGWLVHGVVGEADRPDQAALMLLVKASQQEIEGAPEEMLKRIFDIDGLGGGKNQDEKDPAEEQFKNSLTTEEGRYCVTLPWKDGHPLLPTYEEAASAQLRSQLRRMKRCPEVLEKYDKQLKDYVEGGFAEIIDPKAESSEGGIVTYILHLEVIRLDKSSTNVRPVFNASFGKPS